MFPSLADGGLGSFRPGMMQFEFDKQNGFALHDPDDDDGSLELEDSGIAGNTSPPPSEVPASPPDQTRANQPCSKTDTVEVLRPEEIRWFYKVEADRKWTTFDGYDSQRIEFKHRELKHLQHAGDSDRSDELDTSAVPSEDECEPRLPASEQGPTGDSGGDTVSVRGGLYQVDVQKRTCFPIYWSAEGHTSSVMCGTWFLDGTWQPVEEMYADQIEAEHLRMFQHERIGDSPEVLVKGQLPVIHHISFSEFHVDWNGTDKVYLHYETTSSKLYRAVGCKLGLSKSGTKLHRGYCYEAGFEEMPCDITHLVFVIHGIGQKMDTNGIVKSCADLREACQKVKEKCLPELDKQQKRAEFLPVEWRSSLKLDGGLVNSITPNKLRGLRSMLNSTAMDILYYSSPLYRAEITRGLQRELNRLYAMFCTRHPYFEEKGGKVSIIAHSLGCVITYDILTGWNPAEQYDQYVSSIIDDQFEDVEGVEVLASQLEAARKRVNKLEIELLKKATNRQRKTSALRFKLENFFCLGSPLAVFLALRGKQATGGVHPEYTEILPTNLCCRMFNVYHPSDPIARLPWEEMVKLNKGSIFIITETQFAIQSQSYRLEPLILRHYTTLMPVPIHRFDSRTKEPYDTMAPIASTEEQVKITPKKCKSSSSLGKVEPEESGSWSNMFRWGRKRDSDSAESLCSAEMAVFDNIEKMSEGEDDDDAWVTFHLAKSASDEEVQPNDEMTELPYRLDYQLREAGMAQAYIAALTAHTSYWTDCDVALFILSYVFPEYESTCQSEDTS